jgi:hypothetical protein
LGWTSSKAHSRLQRIFSVTETVAVTPFNVDVIVPTRGCSNPFSTAKRFSTVKLTEVAPAGTVTVAGIPNWPSGRVDVSETIVPAAGAGPLSVTVPVLFPSRFMTVELKENPLRMAGVIDRLTVTGAQPFRRPWITDASSVPTGEVVMEKFAVDAPAGTDTLAGPPTPAPA